MKPPQKAATLHDVATHSGVSYQTVSRVVNNHPSVAEATRNRVLRSIEALKYRPNRAARSLVTNRSDTLAIMSFGSTFYGPAQMLANITQYARSKGYRVSPTAIEQLTHDDVRAALDDLHEHLIDGVILIAPVVSDVMSEVNELAGRIPYIQIDTAPRPGVASTGTTPHSHTGNAKPMNAPTNGAANRLRGSQRTMSSRLTNTSSRPETAVPSSRNGAASMKMPRNRVAKMPSVTAGSPRVSSRAAMPIKRAVVNAGPSQRRAGG